MKRFRLAAIGGFTLVAAGAVLLGNSVMIPAKALLAHHLIESAWEKVMAGDSAARPWPWMDSVPVARLRFPGLEKDFIIMRGASGAVLAFAPGWHEGTEFPGTPGISLIAAHRDTHFGFLRDLEAGQEIELTDIKGGMHLYVIEEMMIVQDPEIRVPVSETGGTLILSTCFPFNNWQPGGDMRFVVVAREVTRADITLSYAGDLRGGYFEVGN